MKNGLVNKSFVELIKQEENSIKMGFNKVTQTWFSHVSLEGGTDTIGYGHKLTTLEDKQGAIIINGNKVSLSRGLTDEQVDDLLLQDLSKHESIAKRHFGKAWETMSRSVQLLAVEISFNITNGLKGYPSFTRLASNPQTQHLAVNEIGRGYRDGQGNFKPLTRRVESIKKWFTLYSK